MIFRVFGYGSLMWRPGFSHLDCAKATLKDYRRSFCVYSHHHRGTAGNPGLVLGLDHAPGAECQGVVFDIDPAERDTVMAYLAERELVHYPYIGVTLPVETQDQGMVDAYTFIVDTTQDLYAGDLGLEKSAQLIMSAQGISGLNRDYLINTVRDLEQRGYMDDSLHALLKKVEYLTGMIDAGGGI